MDAKQDDDVAANFAAKLGGLKLELGGPSKSAADESDVVKSSSASPPVAAWSARQVSPTPLPSPDMSQSLHATVMRVTDVLGHFYSKVLFVSASWWSVFGLFADAWISLHSPEQLPTRPTCRRKWCECCRRTMCRSTSGRDTSSGV